MPGPGKGHRGRRRSSCVVKSGGNSGRYPQFPPAFQRRRAGRSEVPWHGESASYPPVPQEAEKTALCTGRSSDTPAARTPGRRISLRCAKLASGMHGNRTDVRFARRSEDTNGRNSEQDSGRRSSGRQSRGELLPDGVEESCWPVADYELRRHFVGRGDQFEPAAV